MTAVHRRPADSRLRRVALPTLTAIGVALLVLIAQAHAAPPASLAGAADVPEVAPEGAAATIAPDAPAPLPRRVRPMIAEMMAALESERSTLAELRARPLDHADPGAALALQREIERVKVETERTLLRIQASWARREGRLEVARAIEASLEEMARPRPVRAGVRVPTPATPTSEAPATSGR